MFAFVKSHLTISLISFDNVFSLPSRLITYIGEKIYPNQLNTLAFLVALKLPNLVFVYNERKRRFVTNS